jgi:ribonuclease J
LSGSKLRVIPLGGVTEVGKNMLLIEHEDSILVVDSGLGFPEDEMLGVDLVIPDTSYLRERSGSIVGIVITHGHEDHIGALPYVLPGLGYPPIYSTKLTRGLIEGKLREHGLLGAARLNLMQPGEVIPLGSYTIEPFHVCHSIPDGVGLGIDTPEGLIVHTGDFKFDQTPVDGWITDFHKLTEFGSRSPLLLLSDCVHVESPGNTPSERVVGSAFDTIFSQCAGRIIVATFASLIPRVQQVLDVANARGRKVAVMGRSLDDSVSIALQMGYLHSPDGTLIKLSEATKLPHNEVVYLVTGSQGEPMSVLSRIASQDVSQIRIIRGDTVIISATPIPGNETSVARIINSLFQQGANVVYSAITTVHVSGHASQEELKLMLNLVKPQFCAPIHGDYRHMVLYSRLAQDVGLPGSNVLLPEVGSIMEFSEGVGRVTDKVEAGHVFVDGMAVEDVGQVVMRDRQTLARDGMLIVVVSVDSQTGRLAAGPDVISKGFVYEQEAEEVIEAIKQRVLDSFALDTSSIAEWSFLHHKIKNALAGFVYRRTRRRPMILPIVMEV